MVKRKRSDLADLALGLVLAAGILGSWIGYNAWAYGDWSCAFSRCVKVANVKL